MTLLKIQLTHYGEQKTFSLKNGTPGKKGYATYNGQIYRNWNEEKKHFRKFIECDGLYLDNVSQRSTNNAKLFFWGEWEGNSFFKPLINNDYRRYPNGIHSPFHVNPSKGSQNTDPYIFGDYFKYAFCKQTGLLECLDPGSIILFGSTYPSLDVFYLDTVFVVKSYESESDVYSNSAKNYSQTYKEATLHKLNPFYLGNNPIRTKRLYHGQSWWDTKEYFSFVPCKLSTGESGFERMRLDLNNSKFKLSRNATGKSYLKKCTLKPNELWNEIVNEALKQDFKLGVKFNEPISLNEFSQYD